MAVCDLGRLFRTWLRNWRDSLSQRTSTYDEWRCCRASSRHTLDKRAPLHSPRSEWLRIRRKPHRQKGEKYA
jgi:hypothetical protein